MAAQARPVTYQTVRLARGKHTTPDRGACVMELASMLAGEPFSDRPQSVCPVVASLLRAYNDAVDDDRRQELFRYAADSIGTRGPRSLERARVDRCIAMLSDLESSRPGVRRLLGRRHAPMSRPRTDAELERMSARLVRGMRRAPESHARTTALLDGLIAMHAPSALTGFRSAWAPGPRSRAPLAQRGR